MYILSIKKQQKKQIYHPSQTRCFLPIDWKTREMSLLFLCRFFVVPPIWIWAIARPGWIVGTSAHCVHGDGRCSFSRVFYLYWIILSFSNRCSTSARSISIRAVESESLKVGKSRIKYDLIFY